MALGARDVSSAQLAKHAPFFELLTKLFALRAQCGRDVVNQYLTLVSIDLVDRRLNPGPRYCAFPNQARLVAADIDDR